MKREVIVVGTNEKQRVTTAVNDVKGNPITFQSNNEGQSGQQMLCEEN